MRIVALGQRAAHLGLEPGLMLAEARARVLELVAVPHAPVDDAALLGEVAGLCGNYTSTLELRPPDEIALDIGGSVHLFGGAEGLRAALAKAVSAMALTPLTAMATTADAACALARFGCQEIAQLPIAALQLDSAKLIALRRAGLHRIGDLAALPPAPLAARFGPELVLSLVRLTEQEDPRITALQTVEEIREEARFAEPVGRSDYVHDVIEMLIMQAAEQLRERDQGARALVVRLHRSDGHVAMLKVECGIPTRDPAVLMRLLGERIDSLADPLDPGFGYDAIDIAMPHVEHLVEWQQGLEPERTPPPDIAPLLDRLAVRHGADAILRFAAGDSHLPERAGTLRAGNRLQQIQAGWQETVQDDPPLRPLLLFDPPQRLQVIAAVPDGPPQQFRWRGKAYRIIRQEGPERIAPEWWRLRGGHIGEQGGNPGLSRDYYRVEDEAGHRFWLFRHGLYGRESNNPAWYIHGLFA